MYEGSVAVENEGMGMADGLGDSSLRLDGLRRTS